MPALDLKDKKLLYELDTNSRQTVQQLARKIGLSKDAVKYRMNRLKQEGIIKSFNAVIDTGKLGFISFRLFLRFYRLTLSKEQEILNFFLNNKNLVWMVRVEGAWDLNTWFLYKDIEGMNTFWNNLLEKYDNYIDKKEFGIYTDITYFSRAYLLNLKNSSYSLRTVSLPEYNNLDKTDMAIITMLSGNARTSVVDIAKKAGVTPKTVIARMKQLKQNKIILGYRTEFDMERLGYQYYKVHISTFNLTAELGRKFKQFIHYHPNIIYYDKVLGGYDMEIEVQVENDQKLRALIEDMRKHFASIIKDYEVLHYYKEYRLRFFPVI